jgi:polysaccharide pyruvyl transferase WcaK-like protein
MKQRVLLITKLKTTNLGNQALSEELMALSRKLLSEKYALTFVGRPMGLEGYTIERLAGKSDPLITFEKWAARIAQKASALDTVTWNNEHDRVKMVSPNASAIRVERWKRKIKPVKRFLQGFLIYSRPYQHRLSRLKTINVLVYSGAGEVGDNNVFLRQLLEIRVAQLLGIKTAAVNQSLVFKTPLFKKLVGLVYGNMVRVVVRGTISRDNLTASGVAGAVIHLAPDTAFRNEAAPATGQLKTGTIGFNLTNVIRFDVNKIKRIVEFIQSKGRKIIFITNEPFGDSSIATLFKNEFNIESLNVQSGYQEYSHNLSAFQYVVSARLHTNVLALTAGVPVIPVEGNVFKTKELLTLSGYPVEVVDSTKSGWEDQLFDRVRNMEDGKYELEPFFRDSLPRIRERVEANLSWLREL